MLTVDSLAIPYIFIVKRHQVLETLLHELPPLCPFVDFFGLSLTDVLNFSYLCLFLFNGFFLVLLWHVKLSVLSYHNSRGYLFRTAISGVRVQEASHLVEVLYRIIQVDQLGKSVPVHSPGCVALWHVADCWTVTVLGG